MNSLLVFSPSASPTYSPFGMALLSAQVNRHLPQVAFDLFDANLFAWEWLRETEPSGEALGLFLKNRSEAFFNPDVYTDYLSGWNGMRRRMRTLIKQAGIFVESGELSDDLRNLLERMRDQVLKDSPVLIGFSMMYLDQLNFTLALAKYIRVTEDNRQCKIVIGGASLMALDYRALLRACDFIDALVIGEGERSLISILQGVENKSVPGLVFRDEGQLIKNGRFSSGTKEGIFTPDFSRLNLASYYNPETVLPVVFSRDCKWRKCRFCAHNLTFSGYRKRSVISMVDELVSLKERLGVRHFYFTDQYVDADSLEMISDEIIRRDIDISYHVMCRPVAEYTPDRLAKMSASGCRWISWGVESGSQRLLDLVKKGTQVEGIKSVISSAAKAGISNLAMLILGLPTSSEIDMTQTFYMLDEVQESLDAIRMSTYVLYKDTYFGKNWRQYGLNVTGQEVLLRVNNIDIHSTKLYFRELTQESTLRPPRGRVEYQEWEKRRNWMKDTQFMEELPCEHYLLYASHQHRLGLLPKSGFSQPA